MKRLISSMVMIAAVALATTGRAEGNVSKPADMKKPVKVFILMGQSNMCGMGKYAGLEAAVKQNQKYSYLMDKDGNWTTWNDVRNVYICMKKLCINDWMTVKNQKLIGVEYGIAHFLRQETDAPLMMLKCCVGNRSLGYDLLPPGSEKYEVNGQIKPGYGQVAGGIPKAEAKPTPPKRGKGPGMVWYAGIQWDDDVGSAKGVLADLNKYYPGAKSYEVAGFFFWQGEKDHGDPNLMNRYEENLVRFIKALRKEFNAPNAKFVCATLGESEKGSGDKVMEAHLAVDGTSGKYPEFKGNVAAVYTHDMAQGGAGNGHYNGNAEVYMDVGEAMGKAMAELLKK
jgi:hypothetical protein